MPWASRPDRSASYTVAEAHGSAHYMPNTLVTIEVRVTSYEYKYKGLIMDAVRTTADGNGTTQETVVGRFVFPEKREGLFWEPPNCNGSGKVLHVLVLRKEGVACAPPTLPRG